VLDADTNLVPRSWWRGDAYGSGVVKDDDCFAGLGREEQVEVFEELLAGLGRDHESVSGDAQYVTLA